jgi:hypothetical protein
MERIVIFVVAIVVYVIYRVIRGSNQGSAAVQGTEPPRYSALYRTPPFMHSGESFAFSEILPDPNLPQIRSIGLVALDAE